MTGARGGCDVDATNTGQGPSSAGQLIVRSAAPATLTRRLEFAHLARLTDRHGVRERIDDGLSERPGYRTTDAARALALVLREDRYPAGVTATAYLSFLEHAVRHDGSTHPRMSAVGQWQAPDRSEAWGRSVAALGATVASSVSRHTRDRATDTFLRAAKSRSLDVRTAALAALGAASLVTSRTDASGAAHSLLSDCLEIIPRKATARWSWPEARLGHNNAVLCDALILGGVALGRPLLVRQGLAMLGMLLETETGGKGYLSVTGSRGRSASDTGSRGVQLPSDVAAIADACAHAFTVTGELHWRRGVCMAWNWFLGSNDYGTPVYDTRTGIATDSLQPLAGGTSGAEATLAALSTLQRRRQVGPEAARAGVASLLGA